jgi:Leucine-rich repeat (LRR) protein
LLTPPIHPKRKNSFAPWSLVSVIKTTNTESTTNVKIAVSENVEEVSLGARALKEFPAELLAVASRVQSLELFMNNFTFLPPSISTFSSLTRLELMRNEITTLPGSFFSFFSKENIYI